MSADELPQLSRADVTRLAKTPGALEKARVAGKLREVMAGRDPGAGHCPHCGGSLSAQADLA